MHRTLLALDTGHSFKRSLSSAVTMLSQSGRVMYPVHYNYFAPLWEAKYRDDRVGLSLCLLCPTIPPELHVRSSSNFMQCMLPMSVARSFSGGVAIRYVLPVLRMTSYLHIMRHMRGVGVTLKLPGGVAVGRG